MPAGIERAPRELPDQYPKAGYGAVWHGQEAWNGAPDGSFDIAAVEIMGVTGQTSSGRSDQCRAVFSPPALPPSPAATVPTVPQGLRLSKLPRMKGRSARNPD